MRTTIRLEDGLLREVKKRAAETGRPLTGVIEDALREVISRRKTIQSQNCTIALQRERTAVRD